MCCQILGSHKANGEPSVCSAKGREVDLLALGELPSGELSDQWSTAIASGHVAGVVAYTLAYSALIGRFKVDHVGQYLYHSI